jgi:hypothetical protein
MNADKEAELMKRRDALRDRLERLRRDLQTPLDRDLDEQALQLENRDTLIEIQRVTRQELARVEDQIARLGRSQ